MKFAFFTLGCKVNRFETQALTQLAEAHGHEIVTNNADAVIINTCTVTSVSDHKNIRAFHKLRRENPNAILAACGCFAQTSPDQVRSIPEIDLICGTDHRADVVTQCEEAFAHGTIAPAAITPPTRQFEILPAGVPNGRTRALLKIQDGCDNYCTYCIIPYARGHVRSMPHAEVLTQIQQLSAGGVQEIVLTGIEISSYGADLPPFIDLTTLLEQICAAVPHIRIRLSSLEPRTISEDFCKRLSKYPNLMEHFHLSLQSGCDRILQRMKRRYTTTEFYHNVQLLRDYFPHCAITTDVIAGFPGETEQDHLETLAFVERCQLASMHVFPYSPRKGTIAAEMEGQLPPQEKQRRAEALKTIARRMEKNYLETFIGKTLEILLEHSKQENIFTGHTRYHFSVQIHASSTLPAALHQNQLISVKVTGRDASGLYGNFV